mmetsp:Transcript_12675/g.23013  ORF Transcript_12675/g.23013 Transcript_12675/m.23013 type:complete len:194 (+) Transcript_12675:35-616(+)
MIIMSSVEARLQALEAVLRVNEENAEEKDVERRLTQLEQKLKSTTPSSLHVTWDESDRLLKDLHPGSNLTYQQPSKNYPILFRRKEVLAASDSLKADMDQLSTILNLILIAQKQTDSILREEQVTQAPILTSVSISEEHERRLDKVAIQISDVNRQVQDVAHRIDSLVECYHSVMTSISEKMVAVDEALKGSC